MLQDQKNHETLCVQKYHHYAGEVQDPQLKQLFNTLAGKEQQHYNTIEQILNGQVPSMSAGGQQAGGQAAGGQQASAGSQYAQSSKSSQAANSSDAFFCQDMLSTEKFVSGTYDTTIFECTDPMIRQSLNHIQKEEQQHGEQIFQYMQSKGMYNVK